MWHRVYRRRNGNWIRLRVDTRLQTVHRLDSSRANKRKPTDIRAISYRHRLLSSNFPFTTPPIGLLQLCYSFVFSLAFTAIPTKIRKWLPLVRQQTKNAKRTQIRIISTTGGVSSNSQSVRIEWIPLICEKEREQTKKNSLRINEENKVNRLRN